MRLNAYELSYKSEIRESTKIHSKGILWFLELDLELQITEQFANKRQSHPNIAGASNPA